jgi:CHAD domain-containing protein
MTSPTRVLPSADEGGRLELESIVSALSAQFAVDTGSRRVVRRSRLDTFDRRLSSAGLTLEHQIVGAGDSGERLVLTRADGSTVAAPVKSPQWPALAGALPAGPVRDAVAAVIGIRALLPTSQERRRVRRLELRNGDGKTVARVEVDEPDSTATAAPAQVTVRGLRGYDEQARRADRLLAGLGLLAVQDSAGAEAGKRPSPVAGRDTPARSLLAAALSDFLLTMRENLPGLLDEVDTEFLHDFRVAVRRTRATLKLGRPVLPVAIRQHWEPEFKWLGDITTPVRDLDVYVLDLPMLSSWLLTAEPADLGPLATHLRSRRTVAHLELAGSLRSARFRRLVTQWDVELAELARIGNTRDTRDTPQEEEHRSAGQLADRAISRAYRRVARDGAVIGADSPAEDLHDLRKRCKELRYALEVFAGPLAGQAVTRAAVSDLKGLQDVLGRFQDSEVQRHALRTFAQEMMAGGTPAGAVLAMGELIGHLDVEQDRARREFDAAFARFDRPSSRRLMHRLGGGL